MAWAKLGMVWAKLGMAWGGAELLARGVMGGGTRCVEKPILETGTLGMDICTR